MPELVRQDGELGSRGEAVQHSDASTTRQTERASQIVDVLEADAVRSNRLLESGNALSGITSHFGGPRQWRAVGLVDVLSRDSADFVRLGRRDGFGLSAVL